MKSSAPVLLSLSDGIDLQALKIVLAKGFLLIIGLKKCPCHMWIVVSNRFEYD